MDSYSFQSFKHVICLQHFINNLECFITPLTGYTDNFSSARSPNPVIMKTRYTQPHSCLCCFYCVGESACVCVFQFYVVFPIRLGSECAPLSLSSCVSSENHTVPPAICWLFPTPQSCAARQNPCPYFMKITFS